MANLTGQSLGRYHILEQLGEGGMAIVYKAYDTRLESEVAVKVIRTERFSPEILQKALKRFEREAKSLAQLTHPNIVKVLDYGEFEGQPYLVMPYLPGGTLKQLLNGKPMLWQRAARLLIPILRSLDYAHKRGIVHRDIKPSNIMITESGEPMLTDFGVAKIIDEEATLDLTGTSAAVGTPEYMAPEQTTSKTTDHRVDIYALGIVFYEMVTGRKPFQADTPLAVLFKHASEPLPRPSQFVAGIPDSVEKILVKALAKKPIDRYQSMGEVAEVLDALLSGNVRSPKISRPKKEFTSSSTHEPVPASKRPIVLWVSLAVVGISVFGLLMSLMVRGGGTAEVIPTNTPPFTITPFATQTLSITNTPFATNTPLATATPELGIGSTMTGKDGMTLLYIPAGEFMMGSTGGDEKPVHKVQLDAFWIDQTEVTNKLFSSFIGATGYQTDAEKLGSSFVFNGFTISNGGSYQIESINGADWQHPTGPGSDISSVENFPVINVSWNDAVAYCEWTSGKLPTEAEWEKAAGGTGQRSYPWGDEAPNNNLANFGHNIGHTTEVGDYPNGASFYGVYDMAGNVEEWVNDWYQSNYYATLGDSASNPQGPSNGSGRVVRGGSWLGNSPYIRVAQRGELNPTSSSNYMGFRCAHSLP